MIGVVGLHMYLYMIEVFLDFNAVTQFLIVTFLTPVQPHNKIEIWTSLIFHFIMLTICTDGWHAFPIPLLHSAVDGWILAYHLFIIVHQHIVIEPLSIAFHSYLNIFSTSRNCGVEGYPLCGGLSFTPVWHVTLYSFCTFSPRCIQ